MLVVVFFKVSVVMPGSTIYSYELDAVWTGQELAYSQGWPTDLSKIDISLQEFKSSQLQELSGNAFSLPIWTVVATAFWLNPFGTWWAEKDVQDSGEEAPLSENLYS